MYDLIPVFMCVLVVIVLIIIDQAISAREAWERSETADPILTPRVVVSAMVWDVSVDGEIVGTVSRSRGFYIVTARPHYRVTTCETLDAAVASLVKGR